MEVVDPGSDSASDSGRDFYTFYDEFNSLVDEQNWSASQQLSKYFACKDSHAQFAAFQIADIDDDYSDRDVGSAAFDNMLGIHFRVLFYLNRREYDEAFLTQMTVGSRSGVEFLQLLQYFNKEILSKEKDQNWFIPVLYTFCSDLRIIASMADKTRKVMDEDEKSFYEEAANPIMESYRLCVAEGRTALDITKKVAILNLTNNLFRIYFRTNRLHLLKPLIRAIEHAGSIYDTFSRSDQVTYKYYVGRKAIFDNDLLLADVALSFAFANCPSHYAKNKRLILLYLIPVKMFLGQMPASSLLEQYGLQCFHEIILAVKDGDLQRLDKTLIEQQNFFISCGIFLMLDKLKQVAYLNLMKSIYKITNASQIKLEAVVTVLNEADNNVDVHEVGCILGNLILQKKMKGYISYNHQTLVLSKNDPFPKIQ